MYLNSDDRTGVLLEALEDAETSLNNGADSTTLLRHVIVTAKRHHDWPENERKRMAEYEAKKAAEAAATKAAEVPEPVAV